MQDSIIKQSVLNQMLAILYMLKDCIDRCPEKEWNEHHNDYPFSQVVFHTLLDIDYNLSENEKEFENQYFHQNNIELFKNYKDIFDYKKEHLYERNFIKDYFEFCSEKIESTMKTKDDADFLIPNTDIYKVMTRLERYINAIRHTQHHTAQLGLRIQYITSQEMEWISSGNKNSA